MNRIALKASISPPVFFSSAGLLIAFLAFGTIFPHRAKNTFESALTAISNNFGWLYVLAVAVFIGFCVYLLLSKYGHIRLGDDNERPRFSRASWFAMLFSAGMGIGLVFYGVAEPITHFNSPPTGNGGIAEAGSLALSLSFFHWGIHAWSIYVLMALGIAYFAYRKKLPLAIRSCFYPVLGDRIFGPIGHTIDIIAVFGTLFGLATSLALGAKQVSAGLHFLFDTPHTTNFQLTLIMIITLAAMVSLITGIDKGIRRLSELNMLLAACLLLFVFMVGPTLFILNTFVENLGGYITIMIDRSLEVGALDPEEKKWIASWTLFYWGWWIAWAPFVGTFVARISRGRTIRELVLGGLLVPTLVTFIWFSVFGGTAIYQELFGQGGIAEAVKSDVSTAVYVLLEEFPLAEVTSLLTACVVAVFFVTSSDSASYVVDMLTSGGHPNPPVWQRVFWACAEGACAAVLLYAGGKNAIAALQAAVITVGLPFCILMLIMVYSIFKALRSE